MTPAPPAGRGTALVATSAPAADAASRCKPREIVLPGTSRAGSSARGAFASVVFECDAAVDEDAVDERREDSIGLVWAGFPKFGCRPPRGPGRLPGVLLTVFGPTGRPIGGGIAGGVLEAEGCLLEAYPSGPS